MGAAPSHPPPERSPPRPPDPPAADRAQPHPVGRRPAARRARSRRPNRTSRASAPVRLAGWPPLPHARALGTSQSAPPQDSPPAPSTPPPHGRRSGARPSNGQCIRAGAPAAPTAPTSSASAQAPPHGPPQPLAARTPTMRAVRGRVPAVA
eukprot:scaffold606_cov115-Isochrysis_galbana.AAC.5